MEQYVTPLSHHIPFATLVDLAEGRRESDAQQTAHLSACARCAADRRWLEQTMTLMRTDDSTDAPAHVIDRAVRLMRPQEAGPSLLRRVLATLSFDSAQMQPAFGLRAGQPAMRQLLFNAEGRDIDLRISGSGDVWIVAGQVLGSCQRGAARLRNADSDVQTELNNLCEFALSPVAAGTYTLTLRLDDVEVELGGLEVGA
jgi:hypothetical protein